MADRGCLRCKVIVTLPDGREIESFLSISLHKKPLPANLKSTVRSHLDKYHALACERLGGHCKVRIVEPCQLVAECG